MKSKLQFNLNAIVDNQWTIYFAFVLMNVIVALNHATPYRFPSEYSVVSIGQWIRTGSPLGFRPLFYYGYTFSPFVAILLSFFDNIRAVHIGSLIIKAFQVALVPFFTYKILKEVLDVKSALVRVVIPLIIGLFPAFTVYSKLLSNDTTLHFTMFICFYLIAKCAVLEDGKVIRQRVYSALLGFFAVFSYATHGLGLAFIVAIFMTLAAAHIFTKRKLVCYISFLASFAIFFIIDSTLKDIVMDNVFRQTSVGGVTNTFYHSFNRMMRSIFEPDGLAYLFRVAISRTYYSLASTLGFFPLSLVIMSVFAVNFVKSNRSDKIPVDRKPQNVPIERALFILAVFSFTIFACHIGLSTLDNIERTQDVQGRFFFYGRYYEYALMPMVMLGLYYLMCRKIVKKTLTKYVGITAAIFFAFTLYVQLRVIEDASSGGVMALFIPGIIPFYGNTIGQTRGSDFNQNVIAVALVVYATLALSLYLLTSEKRKQFSLFVLLGLFIYGTHFSVSATTLRDSNNSYNNIFSVWDEPRRELEEFRDIHEEFPYLYLVSTSFGRTTNNNMLQSRGALSLLNFNVTRSVAPDRWEALNKVENSMIISDVYLSPEEIGSDALNIHASETSHIWLRGPDIVMYYLTTREVTLSPETFANAASLADALRHFEDLYEQFPNAFLLADNHALIMFHAGSYFDGFDVRPMAFNTFNPMRRRGANFIVVSDTDHQLEEQGDGNMFKRIYESEGAFVWIRGEEIHDVYSNMTRHPLERLTNVLQQFEDLHSRFPNAFIITDSIDADHTDVDVDSHLGGLGATIMSFEEFDPMRKPRNMIVISDTDHQLEERGTGYQRIHESGGTFAWIRGADIRAAYLEREEQ